MGARVGGHGTFVGRKIELGLLRSLLDDARAGRGSAAMLVGEAGIGKTTTAGAFAEVARAAGMRVFLGRCYDGDDAPPYAPWVEAAADFIRIADAGLLRSPLGPIAPALAQLIPGLAEVLGDRSPPEALGAEMERVRLREAFVRLFRAAAEDGAVVLLDDLQWADAASLQLLEDIARLLSSVRLLILGSYREVPLSHPLGRCLAEVDRLAVCRRLPLRSLTLDETAALVEHFVPGPVPREAIRSIHAETAGNPFFIEQVAQHFREEGRDVGTLAAAGWGIPESVRQAVGKRLARLGPETMRMLEVAAAFTGSFDLAVLQALTDLPDEVLLAALDDALRARMIRASERTPEGYEFAHAIVRDTLYAEANPSRRARLHRRIAQALERLHAGAEMEQAAELAFQYQRSATLPGAEHGVRYALAAAEQARAAYAHEQSVRLLRIARDLAARSPATMRADILRRLAMAEAEALLLDASAATIEGALGALAEAGATPDTVTAFLAEVAGALKDGGASEALVARLAERGVALCEDRRDLVWARLKLLPHPIEVLQEGPIRVGRWTGFDPQAVRIARLYGDEDDFARSLELMEWRSLEELAQLRTIVRAWSRPRAAIHALTVIERGLVYYHGAFAALLDVCEELRVLSERHGSAAGQAYALVGIAQAQREFGEFAACRDALAAAREHVAKLGGGHRLHVVVAATELQLAADTTADWLRIARWCEEQSADRVVRLSWTRWTYAGEGAYAHARLGHAAEARRWAAALASLLERVPPRTLNFNGAVWFGGAAAWEIGDRRLAERYAHLADAAIADEVGDYPMGSLVLTTARMAAIADETERALAAFAEARRSFERDGRRPLRAIVDHDESVARMRFGAPDAGALADAARAQFAALGMPDWLDRAERLAATLRGAPAVVGGLTARELDVLRLIAGGCTNREIAQGLVVSLHTVERHVSNIYTKIGARNRADATAFALRKALVGREAPPT